MAVKDLVYLGVWFIIAIEAFVLWRSGERRNALLRSLLSAAERRNGLLELVVALLRATATRAPDEPRTAMLLPAVPASWGSYRPVEVTRDGGSEPPPRQHRLALADEDDNIFEDMRER